VLVKLAEHHRAGTIGRRYSFFDDEVVEPNVSKAAESKKTMFQVDLLGV
jgi:hypothetical protein